MINATDRNKAIAVDLTLSLRTVRNHLTVSRDLRKYFAQFDFWSRYDVEVVADPSVLVIPILSILLPFAWVTGSDVYVDELDRTFAESMNAVHKEYKRMYPGLPFRTRLIAGKLVDNRYVSNEVALLFSGGLDATYSLFNNVSLKPRLIMILGTSDIPISNVGFQKIVEREYSTFAEREGLPINFVRTNALEVLNVKRVDHLFGSLSRFQGPSYEYYRTDHWSKYWDAIGYTLGHVGQTAPLSIGRFNSLLLASGVWLGYGRAANRKKDTNSEHAAGKIAWGNLRVTPDGSVHRYEKALLLKQVQDAHRIKLRVCLEYRARPSNVLNCNHCWKCLWTIAPLTLVGLDPNECGFSADQSTLYRIRGLLKYNTSRPHRSFWKELQQAVPDEIACDRYDARRFFEWFKTVDIDSMPGAVSSPLSKLYHRLPYPIANLLRIVWEETPAQRARFYMDLAFAPPRERHGSVLEA